MSESRIGDTSLGKPSSNVRHNVEIKNGERYTANLYDFYSGKNLIFTARCINGVVTQVWDERDDPIKQYFPDKNHSTTTEPSVDGFFNPEDFLIGIGTISLIITMTKVITMSMVESDEICGTI